jgi:choline dehydrogenase-like flavoprotein
MNSGIGPRSMAARARHRCRADKPGVGANLQDHLQLRLIYKVEGVPTLNERYHSLPRRAWMGIEYALFRRGPLTMAPSQLGLFTRSGPDRSAPTSVPRPAACRSTSSAIPCTLSGFHHERVQSAPGPAAAGCG